MTRTPQTPDPATFRARSTEDLVAIAPIAIGFHPTRSIVMLGFGGPRPFHARVDLPDETDEVDLVVATLLAPVRKHRVERVAFLVYAADGPLVLPLATGLRDGFEAAGVGVVDVVRVHDHRWYALLPGRPPGHYEGVACDPSVHPFTARAVVAGHVTLGSRDAVRRSVEADPGRVGQVRELLRSGPVSALPAGRVQQVVARLVAEGTAAADEEAVGLALAVRSGEVRDLVWGGLDRTVAAAHVDLWRDVVRRLPEELVASPAAVLAFCAWLAGDGALAWCAVDRARAAQPAHSLARLVSDLLTAAVPPSSWEALRDETLDRAPGAGTPGDGTLGEEGADDVA